MMVRSEDRLTVQNSPVTKASNLWHPFKTPIFRNLIIADVVSDVGSFMQSVGAAWLMVSLHAGPLYVALIQTASALPFFLFALPAGALGDIVDRRKLILVAEIWMAAVAIVLCVTTIAGRATPILLLVLTFALSAGDAFESPTWRAALPELVEKEDLAPAAALNGIEFNFARAVGPALGGVVIAIAGVSTAFLVNAVSNLGVIFVVARWKRHVPKRTTAPETLSGATVAGLRYVRYSPALRSLLLRSGIVMFFASGLLALLPSIAHSVNKSPIGYGILLGCFGFGAVVGAMAMQEARARWSAEAVVSSGILIFGLATVASGMVHFLPALAISALIGGAAWIVFVSLFNVVVLTRTPNWVRARVLAVSMLVFQGAMAAGSAAWGALATRTGIHVALICAGIGTIASTVLGRFLKLPETTVDLTPWAHWRVPTPVTEDPDVDDAGPVLVTVEYNVAPEQRDSFIEAIYEYGRIRRRDGAYEWGVFRDIENAELYLEIFLVDSWAEHLRQHERTILGDRAIEERVLSHARGTPAVRHLVTADEE
jgi:MFS family permease